MDCILHVAHHITQYAGKSFLCEFCLSMHAPLYSCYLLWLLKNKCRTQYYRRHRHRHRHHNHAKQNANDVDMRSRVWRYPMKNTICTSVQRQRFSDFLLMFHRQNAGLFNCMRIAWELHFFSNVLTSYIPCIFIFHAIIVAPTCTTVLFNNLFWCYVMICMISELILKFPINFIVNSR